ncbi:Minichromosome maintenance protein 10 like protein [Aduncisulcus paluster]|uniref:Minichromosome maintenance protein 10 like protein n=1 Tax=Aduncisulcus paluster TaxID=2918883 RepID=A0ABQ5KP67_9EUKA|nr:Minichromosome maintenance protein 10 like protein [Aduncisulcus paluster]
MRITKDHGIRKTVRKGRKTHKKTANASDDSVFNPYISLITNNQFYSMTSRVGSRGTQQVISALEKYAGGTKEMSTDSKASKSPLVADQSKPTKTVRKTKPKPLKVISTPSKPVDLFCKDSGLRLFDTGKSFLEAFESCQFKQLSKVEERKLEMARVIERNKNVRDGKFEYKPSPKHPVSSNKGDKGASKGINPFHSQRRELMAEQRKKMDRKYQDRKESKVSTAKDMENSNIKQGCSRSPTISHDHISSSSPSSSSPSSQPSISSVISSSFPEWFSFDDLGYPIDKVIKIKATLLTASDSLKAKLVAKLISIAQERKKKVLKSSSLSTIDCKEETKAEKLMLKRAQQGLDTISKLDQIDKHFAGYIEAERREEEAMKHTEVTLKAYHCATCRRYSEFKPHACCDAKHPVKVVSAVKRKFECRNCGNRITAFNTLFPAVYCERCNQKKWQVSSLANVRAIYKKLTK